MECRPSVPTWMRYSTVAGIRGPPPPYHTRPPSAIPAAAPANFDIGTVLAYDLLRSGRGCSLP